MKEKTIAINFTENGINLIIKWLSLLPFAESAVMISSLSNISKKFFSHEDVVKDEVNKNEDIDPKEEVKKITEKQSKKQENK